MAPRGRVLIIGAALAAHALYMEALRGHRGDYWCGWSASEALGALAAAGIYWIGFSALTWAFRKLLGAAGMAPDGHWIWVLIAALAAASVWAGLLAPWDGARAPAIGVMAGCLALVLAPLVPRASWNGIAVLLVAPSLAGFSATVIIGQWTLLEPAWRKSAVPASLGYFIVSAGILNCLWLYYRRRHRERRARNVAAAGVILVLTPWCTLLFAMVPSATGPARHNLVLITVDSLRADYCGVYGGQVETPAIERLAKAGSQFERAYALAPWTLPSMYGMFASTYPPSLTPGAGRAQWTREMGRYAVPTVAPMLAERLRAEGYATCAVLGNKLLEQPEGILRGFDESVVFHSAVTVRRGPMAQLPFLQEVIACLAPGLAPARTADTTRPISALGGAFIARQGDRPYFLWLHYMDPHSPWDPPEAYRTLRGDWPIVDPSDAQWGGPQFVANTHQLELEGDARAYVRSLYEGEIAYVDASIGEVLRAIGRGRDASNTLVCVTSDHGEEFWDHGQVTHGQSLYEELVRVPLILSGAGIPVARVEEAISHLDLMPTLADALGVPVPAGWRGKSILPMMRGEDGAAASTVFAQGTYIVAPEPLRMMLRSPHKFIEGLETRDMRVFDLTVDRLERNELVGVDALKKDAVEAMDAWWNTFPARVESLGRDAETPASDMFEQLRSLGYLD